MSNKLQNIKAVNELLAGSHKSQTKKSIYTGSTKTEIPEEDIIEQFDNGKPKIWIETSANGVRTRVTQHEGFKSREPENSVLKTVQDALSVPETCPKCGKLMRDHEKKLNFKFYFMRGKCFECVVKEENKIKMQGPESWKAYQNKIMSANAESWFTDTDKEVEILKTQTKETYYQNADGQFGEMDVSSFINKIDTDYNKLKENIRKQFAETTDGKE
jgi:hypothetical protein